MVHATARGIVGTSLGGVLVLATAVAAPSPAVQAAPLPACPVYAKLPTKPVPAPVAAAVHRYYASRHLLPATIVNNRETMLNVKTYSAGVHWCRNLDGGRSGYVGMVPAKALAAVMVQVRHKAYPVVGSSVTFATLVQMPGTGWKVVSDDTAP